MLDHRLYIKDVCSTMMPACCHEAGDGVSIEVSNYSDVTSCCVRATDRARHLLQVQNNFVPRAVFLNPFICCSSLSTPSVLWPWFMLRVAAVVEYFQLCLLRSPFNSCFHVWIILSSALQSQDLEPVIFMKTVGGLRPP